MIKIFLNKIMIFIMLLGGVNGSLLKIYCKFMRCDNFLKYLLIKRVIIIFKDE